MKKLLMLLLVLSTALSTIAQRKDENIFYWPYNDNTEKIEFSGLIFSPGKSADSIFKNAKDFARQTFTQQQDSILILDSIQKYIVCRGSYYVNVDELGERGKGVISYTLQIVCKPQSYRYALSDLRHFPLYQNGVVGGPLENDRAASGGMLFPMSYWDRTKSTCYKMILATLQEMKQSIDKNS